MKISQEYYDELMARLPGVEIPYNDAGMLAEEFLKASYRAMSEKKDVDNEKLKLEVLMDVAYAQAIEASGGEKITEKKEMAKTNQTYIRAKDRYSQAKNASEFLNKCIQLFENAHIFYRMIFKGRFGD